MDVFKISVTVPSGSSGAKGVDTQDQLSKRELWGLGQGGITPATLSFCTSTADNRNTTGIRGKREHRYLTGWTVDSVARTSLTFSLKKRKKRTDAC